MNESTIATAEVSRICLSAPARLHMGFMDVEGGTGRSFGGLGLAIDSMATVIEVESSGKSIIEAPPSEVFRIERILENLASHGMLSKQVRIKVHAAIPSHAGLGSGTQMALAVGHALSRLNQWNLTTRQIAMITHRGVRSGIGIGAFDLGGFIVDGGRGHENSPPHVVSRLMFPEEWRFLLVFGGEHQGIHGAHEISAFQELPPFPETQAAYLCRLVLLQLLPAIAECNVLAFGRAISTLQEVIGDYFAPQQGGRFANPLVADILKWLKNNGSTGIGQSSWGPTGFAVFGSEGEAFTAMTQARTRWPDSKLVSFALCSGLNHGATVTRLAADSAANHPHLMACNL